MTDNNTEAYQGTLERTIDILRTRHINAGTTALQESNVMNYLSEVEKSYIEEILEASRLDNEIRKATLVRINREQERIELSERLKEARDAVNTLMILNENGYAGLGADVDQCVKILSEIRNVGIPKFQTTKEKVPTPSELFHISEKTLGSKLSEINSMTMLHFFEELAELGLEGSFDDGVITIVDSDGRNIYGDEREDRYLESSSHRNDPKPRNDLKEARVKNQADKRLNKRLRVNGRFIRDRERRVK